VAVRRFLYLIGVAAVVGQSPSIAQQRPASPADVSPTDASPADVSQTDAPASQPETDPKPIVSDAQFDAALPPVDPDLNAPLTPIDQAPMPTEGTVPATPLTTGTGTATTSAIPANTIPTAPAAPDPSLSQPLPPLASFDVTTPAAETTTDTADKPALVRYSVTVEGLKAVDLESRFRSLSALDKGDGKGANGAVIAARAREDEGLAVRLLKSEGYYDASATSNVAPDPKQADRVTATLTVVPGARYKLRNIAITGPETLPPGLAREALQLKTGDFIVAPAIEGAEAAVSLRLPQQGYPFVLVGQRDILLDDRQPVGDYTLPVDPGPRSSFGTMTTTGKTAFDAEHVTVLSRFKPGELYDSRRVEDLREAMVATGLLASVAVEPVKTGRVGEDGNEIVDLLVRQQAGPSKTLAGSAGYGTGEGFKLQGSYTDRNRFEPEGALIYDAILGTQQQGAGVTFRRSNAGKRDRTVQATVRAQREDFDAYEATTASLSGRISRDSTPIWQKRWTYAYGFELIATREKRADPTRTQDDGTYFIAALPGQLGYDRSDNILNPTKGFRLLGRVSPEFSQRANAGGGTNTYVRAQIDGSGYYPVTDSIVLAGRARFGTITGASRDAIAPSRRLYAGGGGSVRGYGYQELGPRDASNNPLGGRGLTELAIEARYRFGDYGIVPFFDAGQVTNKSMPSFSGLRYGAGIGGRFYTNFGPLRVDVATPIARRPGESKITLYISIGQAF
jgi:translocation and assembly module TamA